MYVISTCVLIHIFLLKLFNWKNNIHTCITDIFIAYINHLSAPNLLRKPPKPFMNDAE